MISNDQGFQFIKKDFITFRLARILFFYIHIIQIIIMNIQFYFIDEKYTVQIYQSLSCFFDDDIYQGPDGLPICGDCNNLIKSGLFEFHRDNDERCWIYLK